MAKMETAYGGVDNISRLPDEVLLRILSLLGFEDAVRTSVLSTRWRYLYASISDLILYFCSLGQKKETDVENVVDRIFFYRNNRCPINRFQLRCSQSNEPNPSHLEGWIRALMWHGVRELDLETFSNLRLPASLFTCKRLVVLKLDMSFPSGIEVPVKVCLPSLKVLHLDNVISFWDDDSANRLISSCPVLEHLTYKNENDEENCKVIVSHPILKSLDIDCMTCEGWSGDLNILIDAPSLVNLKYSVCDVNSHTFVNVEHLTEADIYCTHNEGVGGYRDYILAATDLMRGLTNVQRLTISGGTLVDLVKFNIPIPVLPNVTYLEILWCKYFGLEELPHLLARCESLETLLFEDVPDEEWNLDAWYILDEFRCLKTIEIGSFSGTDNQMELVKYFLKSAKVLESMTICIWNAKYEEQLEITKELLMLPRVSKTCSVVFKYEGKLG